VEELVETLDCTRILEDGESISAIWEFQGKHKIDTSITSSEEIQVLLTGTGDGEYHFTGKSQKTYNYQEITDLTNLNATVWNPTWSGDGSVAEMTGSIKVYQIEKKVWLPWWMP